MTKAATLARLLVCGAILLAAGLVWDYARVKPRSFVLPASQSANDLPYDATVEIAGLSCNGRARTVSGQLQVRVRAGPKARSTDISEIALAVWADGDHGEQAQVQYYDARSGLVPVEESDEQRRSSTHAATLQVPLTIAATVVRDEGYFPFDRYSFPVSIEGCAFARRKGSCESPTLRIAQVTVEHEDNFEWHLSGNRFTLVRPFLVRVLVGAFVLTGLVLLVTTGWKVLLGFFGAFIAVRGLLVPQLVDRFPTAFDYAVLLLLAVWVAFAGLRRRLPDTD